MKILRWFLFVSIFTQAYASDTGYEVEIIIFEDTSAVYRESEQWPIMKGDNTLKETINEAKPNQTDNIDTHYQEITPENFKLLKQAQKLVEHHDYNILVHRAWKQEGLDKDQAFSIYIDSKTNIDSNKMGSNDPIEPTKVISESHISGDVKLIMSRYLHISTNLIYQSQSPSITDLKHTNTDETTFMSYHLVFERRMRSREIHYIDHPFIGMIILAIPFKIETKSDNPIEGYQTLDQATSNPQ